MEKDISIKKFVERLRGEINLNLLKFVDYWDGDLSAFGLRKGDKVLYVSTYKMEDHFFYCSWELINEQTEETIRVLETDELISEEDLIMKIKSFFAV
ncbi:hypothetical protein [Terrimonas ferruginea]|uniref:hypothetical protein n=1 Tax=Terrimonas ferruginea TaxID=249 RepID=UPI0004026F6B|nr:hypothetical protein [Terrimonas ferruginea]